MSILPLLLPELHLEAIHQLVPVLAPGDAVSDCALMFQRIFQDWGFRSEIFAESVAGKSGGYTLDQLPRELRAKTGLLLHHSIGSVVADRFIDLTAEHKVLFFQNITPPALLRSRPDLAARAVLGIQQLQPLVREADRILTASRFSAESLPRFAGEPIIVPLAVPNQRAELLLRAASERREPNDAPRILHVGRIVPHKAIEDILRVFAVVQRRFSDAALALVGDSEQVPGYTTALRKFIQQLGLRNVKFYGHVESEELIQFFGESDIYICAGHHEGFCVPPMECMFAELPVAAFAQPAVAETIGDAGIIIQGRDPFLMGEAAFKIVLDRPLRVLLRERQRARREIFTEMSMSGRLKQVFSPRS